MIKCEPAVMRKNLIIVNELKSAGVDFVAIPVLNKAHKKELIAQCDKALDDLLTSAQGEQADES